MEQDYDVIIIGGGPAGYTAALYAARAGMHTLVLEKQYAGGQMIQTTQIENYPGFPDGIDGVTLSTNMLSAAHKFGAETKFEQALCADLSKKRKTVVTSQGSYRAGAVIAATGAAHRMLGLAGEQELSGNGVAYCAVCDAMLYRGKTVAVVGGGNSAVAAAGLLAKVANKVYLIHRRDTLRASTIYHNNLQQLKNVEFLWNSRVTALLQDSHRLTGVMLQNVRTGQLQELSLDGLFVCIGRQPTTELFQGVLALDEKGYILADESTQTSLEGVFAAGDVRSKPARQIVTATADGAVAALQAEAYLLNK